MSRTIHRHVIQVDDNWHTVDLRGPVLHVATREETAVELWCLHDIEQPVTLHAFLVTGTGHPIPRVAARHVGSAVTPSGRFVWHVFEHELRATNDG